MSGVLMTKRKKSTTECGRILRLINNKEEITVRSKAIYKLFSYYVLKKELSRLFSRDERGVTIEIFGVVSVEKKMNSCFRVIFNASNGVFCWDWGYATYDTTFPNE